MNFPTLRRFSTAKKDVSFEVQQVNTLHEQLQQEYSIIFNHGQQLKIFLYDYRFI